jgi:uncharacterized protein
VSADGFTKMSIYGMNMDLFSSSPIVILKVDDENRYLPIWIGQAEARSILFKLQNQEFVRPLTHDLALSLVNELGGSMERITVTELKDSTFFATIRLEIEGKTVEVDSRPSDAIALAIRSGAEIFASDEVIEEAGVVFEEAMEDTPEEEVVDKFKDWMNQVSPEDFKEIGGACLCLGRVSNPPLRSFDGLYPGSPSPCCSASSFLALSAARLTAMVAKMTMRVMRTA